MRIRRLAIFCVVSFFILSFSGCSSDSAVDGEDGQDGEDDGGDNTTSACSNVTAPSWTHPWPMFHGYENHVGRSDAVGPQNANAVWTFDASNDIGNPPNSMAIADDGTIYLGGGGKVYAINPTTPAAIWTRSYPSAQGPALSADGDRLFFGSNKSIVAVNASDGSEVWSFETGAAVHFGPTIGTDGTVYQGSWDHNFYALDPDNGTVKWQYETDGAVSYPPTILNCADSNVGELIILGGGDAHEGEDGKIYAFDTEGNLEWSYDTSRLRVGSPAVGADGLIYAPAGPTLYVLDAAGNLQWQLGSETENNFGIISPAIASDGTVYLPNSGGGTAAMYAIDPAAEAVKTGWPYELSGSDNGIPIFPVVDSQGTVYFGATNGNIYAVNANGGLVFQYATGGALAEASAALVDGVLYISSDDGNLYVIGE